MSGNRLIAPNIDWNSPPKQVRLPGMKELSALPDAELLGVLQRFGITEAWPQAKVSAMGYVSRMSQLPPGSDAYRAEIKRLTDVTERRALVGMTRRAYREYTMIDSLQGIDARTQEFTRFGENDDSTCDNCDELIGDEGTLAYHAQIGMPGAASCEGGDNCRCTLIILD